MRCPICSREIDPDARFCGSCGKRIPRCPVCGTVLYERGRFCANDGAPLPEELFADLPPAEAGTEPQDSVSPPPGWDVSDPEPPRRGGKRSTGTVVLVVLLLVLAAAAAVGIWYVVQNGLPSFGGGADASSSQSDGREDRDRPGDRSGRDSSGEDEEEREIQKALDQADVYAGAGEYAHALAVIREALEDHPRSRELEDALEDYETLYASTLLSDADWLIGEGRLEEAKALLEQGLVSLPGRPDLQDKLHQVEDLIVQAGSAAPVSMSGVLSVSASSWLEEPGLDLYHTPERTVDRDLRTAWVEGLDGPGVGEAITFTFDRTYLVSGMQINAGYQKSEELYQMNDRPASLTLTFSDGTRQTAILQDVYATQDIPFDVPVETDRITLTISSIYRGTTYEDAVISEIAFY